MKTIKNNQIIEDLRASEDKFRAIPCDNNGNPVDWNLYHKLLNHIESLEAILDGKPVVSCANIER